MGTKIQDMEIKRYRISGDGFYEIVEADKLEHNKDTGQELFYVADELVHIAPAHALVLKTTDKIFSQKIVDFITSNIEASNEITITQIKEYSEKDFKNDSLPIAIRNNAINARNQILEELSLFIEEHNSKKQ